ncbi:hypothetical protein QBC37DRAFT_399766 [Rhypophila decipiens]|uniref:Uncharacterized protein n=1 Tax=Rhypophila decipiens TaxID=261697 RepID=A0AAN6Y7V0_9PEZI|nr:hypothetical protein QBC37DRAFT_399766 [Rhypophila decipiens]
MPWTPGWPTGRHVEKRGAPSLENEMAKNTCRSLSPGMSISTVAQMQSNLRVGVHLTGRKRDTGGLRSDEEHGPNRVDGSLPNAEFSESRYTFGKPPDAHRWMAMGSPVRPIINPPPVLGSESVSARRPMFCCEGLWVDRPATMLSAEVWTNNLRSVKKLFLKRRNLAARLEQLQMPIKEIPKLAAQAYGSRHGREVSSEDSEATGQSKRDGETNLYQRQYQRFRVSSIPACRHQPYTTPKPAHL